MAITFYPHEGDLEFISLTEKLEVLLNAAERYKSVVLDMSVIPSPGEETGESRKRMVPREIKYAFNWDELAKTLREIRDLPEANQTIRLSKAEKLKKLAEIYEKLRGAKMPKLEAVRIALMNEANQLSSATSAGAS